MPDDNNYTPENIDILAQAVVDGMDTGELMQYAKDQLEAHYKEYKEVFHNDWKKHQE